MTVVNKAESIVLLLGDIVIFYISLWLALAIRYTEIPSEQIWELHSLPFSILFLVWLVFFYIAGLYEKHTIFIKNKLPGTILNTQIINSLIAVLFFYLIPYFNIAPKTNLFIYLIISFGLIIFWRLFLFSRVFFRKVKYHAVLIGSGNELKELKHEVNNNSRYGFEFVKTVDLDCLDNIDFKSEIIDDVYENNISLFVVDIRSQEVMPILPQLYNLIFSGVKFIDKHKVYESIFDRIPLSLINYNWFIENISSRSHVVYDTFKRLMDISVSIILGIISLVFYPFIILAIYIEDKKNPFIVQERIGKGGSKIKIFKFRTMNRNEDYGGWVGESDNKVTKVGSILRKTRLDELPQLWNVLSGDISLIGPRPDIVGNYERLKKELPYYTIRNVVKPGLSGWAQTHQEIVPQSIEETKTRLAYDLYYIKSRSFLLDLKIALQTIRTLLMRVGR